MVRSTLRARATIVTALLGALFAPTTQAADMPFPMEAPPVVEEGPVEWGSNWYLRGDFDLTQVTPTALNGVTLHNSFPNNWGAGLGGGYKFNNWLRADATIEYQNLYNKNAINTNLSTACVTGLYQPDPVNNPGIVNQTTALCTPFVRNRTESMLVLLNAYLDLGNWWGFTPYVGAGLGVNNLYQNSSVNWFMNNGLSYAGVTFKDPRNGASYLMNWDSKYEGTYLRFAYAFMGGVSYDIDNHWKVDVGYRWANLGRIIGVDRFNTVVSKDLISQQLRIGFRYMID
ncbi:outer membrane protein [Methylocystis sp. JAN1]|uniref:outer membrane protein n=1 Tax=Methylocystis sp. JAN1 TaxID=3397211 RepID=UPI003FA31ADA